jgi:hypothetical protein
VEGLYEAHCHNMAVNFALCSLFDLTKTPLATLHVSLPYFGIQQVKLPFNGN